MSTEQFTFKAEINELMNMIIHNFYSNKDIFLRELISNASDAINKLKHSSLQNIELLGDFYDFLISIKVNAELNQIMIEDTGIGMDREDLINNIGTIISSQQNNIDEGNNLINLNLEKFDSGMYLIKISFENSEKILLQKIIKH